MNGVWDLLKLRILQQRIFLRLLQESNAVNNKIASAGKCACPKCQKS